MEIIIKQVKIIEITSLANENSFHEFIHVYLYNFASFKQNNFMKFRLINTFKPLLSNPSLLFKSLHGQFHYPNIQVN